MNLITLVLFMGNLENNGHITEPTSREYQEFVFPLLYLGTSTGITMESYSSASVGEIGEDDLA